jgi:hypothetical protein
MLLIIRPLEASIAEAVTAAVTVKLVPVAAPKTGVISVGVLSTTNLVPVPVWLAMLVALPTEVIGPVKLALVESLPFSFCIACSIVSVADTVPAPDVYPVKTLPITAELVSVVAFPTEVASPVKLALVVTVPAVKPEAVPVMLVPTNAAGVPKPIALPDASNHKPFSAG